MTLKLLPYYFSVCKLADASQINWDDEFIFFSKTDEELSLVCDSAHVPPNTNGIESGWRAFKIEGILDFSLVGILANIAQVLAEYKISIFVVSTYNTDYILIKADKLDLAVNALAVSGYELTGYR